MTRIPEAATLGVGVRVPGPVTEIPVGGCPLHEVDVLTGDEKPLMDATTMLTVALPDGVSDTDAGDADIAKPGSACDEMVSVNAMTWLRLPLAPAIIMLYVPGVDDEATATVMVETPYVGFGEKLTWTPGGIPRLAARLTAELNLPIGLIVTDAVADCPCWTLMLAGFKAIVKSWVGVEAICR
jgi:hypothetical protein